MTPYDKLPEPVKEHAKMLVRCKRAEELAVSMRSLVMTTERQLADLGLRRQHELSQDNPYAKAFWAMAEVTRAYDKKGTQPWWTNL